MTDERKQEIINKLFNYHKLDAIAIYQYGSTVYGVSTKLSDEDFIVVLDDSIKIVSDLLYIYDNPYDQSSAMSFNLYNKSKFIDKIKNHDIDALECIFLHSDNIVKEDEKFREHFVLNLDTLRRKIMQTVSNSFVKCKKKLEVEHEYYIGKKSLFHSFRILYFGIQIAKHGEITNYAEANHLWFIVADESNDWEHYKVIYQPKMNTLSSEFRLLALKI